MTIADEAFEAWRARAADADILDVALSSKVGAKLRKTSREFVGPCPRCGGKDRFAVRPSKQVFNCRGAGGGNVISMVMHARAVDFMAACEIITGEVPPKGDSAITEETRRKAAEIKARAAERARRRELDQNLYRERERKTVFDIWDNAHPLNGSSGADYLALRGLSFPPTPPGRSERLKCVESMPYWLDKDTIVHRGPALLAPIVDAARKFRGLHLTFLDLAQPKGKIVIQDPREPPGTLLDAKKSRGSKQGNYIALLGPPEPAQLVLGEGIEKLIAVSMALESTGRDLGMTAFWSAADLGNLAGKAADSVAHPTLKAEKTGRPQKVAGPTPDLEAPAIAIPDSVTDLVLLGDTTSDPFVTRLALARASARYARLGRTVRVAWPAAGEDFDDPLRQARGDDAATGAALARIALAVDAANPIEILPIAAPEIPRDENAESNERSARRKPRSGQASSPDENAPDAAAPPPVDSARERENRMRKNGKPGRRGKKNSLRSVKNSEPSDSGMAASDSGDDSPSRPAEDGEPPKPRAFGFSIERLNEEFALVLMGSKAVVFLEQPEAMIEDQKRMLSIDAFKAWFANRFTERVDRQGNIKAVTWATAWMQSRERRSYRGIEFFPDPQNLPGTDGYLNLWSGYAFAPAESPDWRRYKTFRDHLLNNICSGAEKNFRWVFGFFAHMVQRPRERLGVALVMRGRMGSGKTKVGEIFGALTPRHYFLVDDPRYVTGQFNAHMATCLLLQADEAVWAGDKAAEGRLKGLITSPIQQIEAKGVDPIRLPNYVRLIMTSNEEWVVPAGKDERRFAVLDVDPRVAQNHAYFREMDAELEDGGYAHLLGDLLAFDLGSVDLRKIPHTEALLEQKIRSLDSVESWWFGRLRSATSTRRSSDWRREVAITALFDDYIHTADKIGVKRKSEETVFGMKMARLVPDLRRVRRIVDVEDERGNTIAKKTWCYALPDLAAARDKFSEIVQQDVTWPADDAADSEGASDSRGASGAGDDYVKF
jgi:hypothetical protein